MMGFLDLFSIPARLRARRTARGFLGSGWLGRRSGPLTPKQESVRAKAKESRKANRKRRNAV